MRAEGTTGIYSSLAFAFPVTNASTGDTGERLPAVLLRCGACRRQAPRAIQFGAPSAVVRSCCSVLGDHPPPPALPPPGPAVGMANLTVADTNMTCQLPVSASSSGASSSGDSGGGGGTPGWVWAIVGVAAALAVAAAATAVLVWRRRRRRRAAQPQPVLPLAGKPCDGRSSSGDGAADAADEQRNNSTRAVDSSAAPSPFALHAPQRLAGGSALTSNNTTLSPGSSGISKLPSMEVPETVLWRSKVGHIEGLKMGGLIGRGGFAEVYRGECGGGVPGCAAGCVQG